MAPALTGRHRQIAVITNEIGTNWKASYPNISPMTLQAVSMKMIRRARLCMQ
jgi:hypothetical protein